MQTKIKFARPTTLGVCPPSHTKFNPNPFSSFGDEMCGRTVGQTDTSPLCFHFIHCMHRKHKKEIIT